MQVIAEESQHATIPVVLWNLFDVVQEFIRGCYMELAFRLSRHISCGGLGGRHAPCNGSLTYVISWARSVLSI